MNDTISVNVSIPSDNDGYILLKCSHCGAYFKITVADYEDDNLLHIWCPCCGLISENYFTDEVRELANAKINNAVNDFLYDSLKQLERKMNISSSIMKFKVSNKPKHEHESQLHSRVDELIINRYKCCNKSAKISPLKKMSASFCPFCGVINFGDE